MVKSPPSHRVAASLALVLLTAAPLLEAAPPGAPWPAYPPWATPWPPRGDHQRPAGEPSPARGPARPGGWPPGMGRPPAPTAAPRQQQRAAVRPPRVEVSVSSRSPLEQESLVYLIRIVSDDNLRTATPEVPQIPSAVVRRLGETETYSRGKGKEREIVTEFPFLFMPLRAGELEIPPAVVRGRHAKSDEPFEATAAGPLRLTVRSAPPAAVGRLPLYNLRIHAELEGDEAAAVGDPITLTVTLSAHGAAGSQLPSVADQLRENNPDFRVYPGERHAEGRITRNSLYRRSRGEATEGTLLAGSRTETFTLVPRYGGRLRIAPIKVSWWNLGGGRPETAVLPLPPLEVSGGPPQPDRMRVDLSAEPGPIRHIFWIPLMIAVGYLLAQWQRALRADLHPSGRRRRLSGLFRRLLGDLYPPVARIAGRLDPRRHLHRLRSATARRLPVSWKLSFCLRALEGVNEPDEWAHALQILTVKHLDARPNAPLTELGTLIARCHPRARLPQVHTLLRELEGHIYGDQPIDDFGHWKRRFRSQIRPSLLRLRLRRRDCHAARQSSHLLPPLNPRG